MHEQIFPAYKKGLKNLKSSGNKVAIKRLKEILQTLNMGNLSDLQKFNLHPLHGVQKGLYGVHITADHQWVLVFQIKPPTSPKDPATLVLHCIGSHSDCYKYKK